MSPNPPSNPPSKPELPEDLVVSDELPELGSVVEVVPGAVVEVVLGAVVEVVLGAVVEVVLGVAMALLEPPEVPLAVEAPESLVEEPDVVGVEALPGLPLGALEPSEVPPGVAVGLGASVVSEAPELVVEEPAAPEEFSALEVPVPREDPLVASPAEAVPEEPPPPGAREVAAEDAPVPRDASPDSVLPPGSPPVLLAALGFLEEGPDTSCGCGCAGAPLCVVGFPRASPGAAAGLAEVAAGGLAVLGADTTALVLTAPPTTIAPAAVRVPVVATA